MYIVVTGPYDNPVGAAVDTITPNEVVARSRASEMEGDWWARIDRLKLWAVVSIVADESAPIVDVLSVHDSEEAARECMEAHLPSERPANRAYHLVVVPVGGDHQC